MRMDVERMLGTQSWDHICTFVMTYHPVRDCLDPDKVRRWVRAAMEGQVKAFIPANYLISEAIDNFDRSLTQK